MDRRTWRATAHGVAKSWILKRLSTHTQQTLHALNLHNVLCQLHLNKNKFKKVFPVTKLINTYSKMS